MILNHPLFDKSNIVGALMTSAKNNSVAIFNKLLDADFIISINNCQTIMVHAIKHLSNEIINAIHNNPKFDDTVLEID